MEIKRLSKNKKILYLFFVMVFVLLLSFKLPTLARFKNRSASSSNVWSGLVATQYKSGTGTLNDPYIISNGEELAYFSSQLENNNYEGSYFKLSNNILLNAGVFKYEDDVLKYVIDGNTYFVDGNNYYATSDFSGEAVGSINSFTSLDNFSGVFDGDYHVIYGLYIDDIDASLFTDLSGEVTSLYVENAFVKGSNSAAILANSVNGGNISNVLVDGYVLNSDLFNDEISDISTFLDNDDYSISAGIAAYVNNSTLTNCINKADVVGGFLSGGVVGYGDSSSIINSYNIASIDSYISAGIIGVVSDESIISRTYSTGLLGINGGLIGYLYNSNLTINNSFIATDNDFVIDIINSTVDSNYNYYTYIDRGNNISSSIATVSDLKSSSFLTNYDEFVSFDDLETNSLNVWVFDEDIFPVLYIDDIINSYVELNLNTFTWNSYSPNLDTKVLNNDITFMISNIDDIHVFDKYYYVSNSRTALSKDDLSSVSWIPYTDIVQISDEGFYVIYVKVVDNNDNISYINSDLLVLDKSGSSIDINMGDNHWTNLSSGRLYVDSPFELSVSASDELSGISSIEYYISSQIINDFDAVSWISYSDSIDISTVGEYILYVKVVDGCDFITYASTPIIVYDGYVVNYLKPVGFNEGINITSNSTIVYDITYSNNKVLSDVEHSLVSSVILPRNTDITLIDNTNNKVYEYVVNSNDDFGYSVFGNAHYPFSLFKEKGKVSDSYYSEGSISNEHFTIMLDFSNANINSNYNDVSVYIISESDGVVVRPTISKRSFNIYSGNNLRLSHNVSTNYNGSITYNSDSQTDILISSLISYKSSNGTIYDTSYSDKKIGLSIKLVDSSGRIINSNYLKNIIFKVGDQVYTPYSDNIVRINLGTNASVDTTLSVITHQISSSDLSPGTYYIKINGYASYDGEYSNTVVGDPIMIPVVVTSMNNYNNYSFDVSIDSQNRIINQDSGIVTFDFNILQDDIDNPNIKVSMYEKEELTAYNQDYVLIDMQDYTSDVLDRYIDSVYYVTRNALSSNTFDFNLDVSLLDKNGYKFVFDLYDGSTRVGSISKYIIVR